MAKFIFRHGVMIRNPDYVDPSQVVIAPAPQRNDAMVEPSAPPLAIISNTDDLIEANEQMQQNMQHFVKAEPATQTAIEQMQEESYLNNFLPENHRNPTNLESSTVLEQLGKVMAKHEIPIGMLSKLLLLKDRALNFLIDDSGSMQHSSDVTYEEVRSIMEEYQIPLTDSQQLRFNQRKKNMVLTRWQEVETRIHTLIDILGHLPLRYRLKIVFMNVDTVVRLEHKHKSPQVFMQEAHEEVRKIFSQNPLYGRTPTRKLLKKAFSSNSHGSVPMVHYLFTDGEPSDASVDVIAQEIKKRNHPEANALMLMSCTDKDEEVEWFKQVDNDAPFVGECDDYGDERREIEKAQGPAFPYSRGLWLISQLVAAICPDTLDAMDENIPLSRYTMDEILGRKMVPEEYEYYFLNQPHAVLYVDKYNQLLNDNRHASKCISKSDQQRREKKAGYIDGNRPAHARRLNSMEVAKIKKMTQIAAAELRKQEEAEQQAIEAEFSAASTLAPQAAMFPPAPQPFQYDGDQHQTDQRRYRH